jgi:hypothetical protein
MHERIDILGGQKRKNLLSPKYLLSFLLLTEVKQVLRITKKGGAARLKNFQKENFKEKKLAPPNFVTLPTSSGSARDQLPVGRCPLVFLFFLE